MTINQNKDSSNPKDILKSAKRFYETIYIKGTTAKAATTKFLTEVPSRKNI